MKIRTRIMLLFLISILMTTILAVSAATFFGRQVYYDKVEESGSQALQAVSVTMEQMLADIRRDINVLFWNSMIQEKLDELENGTMTPEIRLAVSDTLSAVILSEDAISSILFYDNHGDCCYSYRDGVMVKSEKPIREADWYEAVYEADGEWIYDADGGEIVTYTNDNHNVISMMRTLKLKSDYSVCGVIVVNIDEETIRNRVVSVAGEAANLYLISDKSILFASGQERVIESCMEEVEQFSEQQKLKITNGRKHYIYQKTALKEGGWQLVSEARIDAGLEINIALIAVILGGNILLLLLCWIMISKYVSHPLSEMSQQLAASKGLPEYFAVDEKKTDEISTLKTAYNKMLGAVREWMNKALEEEKSVRQGELELILSQVSPHFLYNTLDTISGMLLSGDEKRSFDLVQMLGRFYRNNLNGGQQLVTLKEEMQTVESYLNILNTRYGEMIQGEYSIPEQLENKKVLKLMLQPLVENAVHHGLRPKGGEGRIMITVKEKEEALLLSVWDNGIGMSQNKIREILESEEETTSGFGIFSIRQRIELYYAVSDALRIESCEGQWTKVTIQIPMREMEK